MRLRIIDEAEAEYREAAAWYDQKQSGLGVEFLDALSQTFQFIEEDPQRFARMEMIQKTSREIHRCLLPRFPYAVIYEVRSDELLVIAVMHVRRRPNYWKDRDA